MKIFIFSLLKLCLGKYENYADGMRIYVHEDDEFLVERGTHVLDIFEADPKAEWNMNLTSGDEIIKKNEKWRKQLEDEESEYYLYVDKMSNINDTKVVTPYIKALNGVDDFKFCWVVVAYDSTIDSLRNELYELTNSLSEHYFERCIVATLDLAYPSNKATFGKYLTDLPSILVRRPEAGPLFKTPTKNFGEIELNVLDKNFGFIIPYSVLSKTPLEEIKKIDDISKNEVPIMEQIMILLEHQYMIYTCESRFFMAHYLHEGIMEDLRVGEFEGIDKPTDIYRHLAKCDNCKAHQSPLYDLLKFFRREGSQKDNFSEPKIRSIYALRPSPEVYSSPLKKLLKNWLAYHKIECKDLTCRGSKPVIEQNQEDKIASHDEL